ncbi:MAG TPA: TonB-dependent receptor plug domain-containing protein, partial [Burkholderiaceae bacterium]
MHPAVQLPARTALALAIAASIFATSHAQTVSDTLPQVVVSATRFANDPALYPVGATIITASDIRQSGINNVNEAVRKLGGVYGRQSTSGSQDFDLDLRGFGTNSSQNMVVMLDGVRLSENELASAILSTIPIDSVERIEITRGGSSVLYGDGATGGVIQIVTRRADARNPGTHGSVFAEGGQFGLREGR